MRYYLGVDAGGTKTHCLVADEQGHLLGFGRAGTGNYEAFGVSAAAAEIRTALESALRESRLSLSRIDGVGLGIAGADIPEDYTMLEREIFTPLFGAIPRVFRNDSMAGLRGGTRDPFGIVIACGTGCVCAGVNRAGEESRVGGINEDFGDKVSGSGIGRDGLRAVWRARDEITGPTLLTGKFLARSGSRDIEEFFHAMYRGTMTIAELQPMAPLVFEAARDGDSIAAEILAEGGKYLGEMVNAVARKLNMASDTFDVVMAGSVFKGASPVLKDALALEVHSQCPHACLVMPLFEPVVGALLLGIELDSKIGTDVYETLARSLDELGRRHDMTFRSE